MDDRAARRRLETQMEAFLSSGMAQHEADELFRLVAELCPDRLDFREVCENLYDGIHITDGEGKVLFINKAYTRTTGIRPEDVLGRRVSDIETEGKLYRGSVTAQVLERRERVNSVATILGLNKEVLVTGTPVFGFDGAIKMVVTNTRDFPELKRLEQQLLTLTEESRKAHEELAYLRRQQAGDKQLSYRSAAMQSVMSLIQTVAPTDVTVLITGESGTGKELVANELYQQRDPSQIAARGQALHQGQLRRHSLRAAGVRALRLRGGGLHRSQAGRQGRHVRAGQHRGHPFG